jgi:hypothetical protein
MMINFTAGYVGKEQTELHCYIQIINEINTGSHLLNEESKQKAIPDCACNGDQAFANFF